MYILPVPGLYPAASMSRLQKVEGERALYCDPSSGIYYIRVFHDGQDTYRSLETTRLRQALERMDARRAAKAAAKLGLALEPDNATRSVTVAKVLQRYQDDGYPDKRGRKRERVGMEEYNCKKLLDYFTTGNLVDDLTMNALDAYHDWRVKNASKGQGHRTTDLELTTLSNALGWAVRKEMVKLNPIKSRNRYHSARDARHCRECAPADVDELHAIAQLLFRSKPSETLGWQLLCEGLTGLRTNEVLSLRMDARRDEPGGLTEDGKSLCVRRSKKPGRDNPYVMVHEGLEALLKAHKVWHDREYPTSPWYFPGRTKTDGNRVSNGALTKALERLFSNGSLKKKFTSHGMRAFFVLVRRSQGASDTQIAWEVNHTGGVGTLESVYGGIPPHWLQGKGPKLAWVPKGDPAWCASKKSIQPSVPEPQYQQTDQCDSIAATTRKPE